MIGLYTELSIPRYTAVGMYLIPTALDRSVWLGMLYRRSLQYREIPSNTEQLLSIPSLIDLIPYSTVLRNCFDMSSIAHTSSFVYS
jgi:hypothetical protein